MTKGVGVLVVCLLFLFANVSLVAGVSLTKSIEVETPVNHEEAAPRELALSALKVMLGNAGIQRAEGPIQNMIAKSFVDQTLPDVWGEKGSGIPGVHVDYHLHNIQVHGFAFQGKTSITLNPTKDAIVAQVSGIYCNLDMDWGYTTHPIHFSGSGTADDELYFNLYAEVQLNNNGKGLPVLKVLSVSIDVYKLDIHLHGGASWFYKIFVDALHGQIEDAFQNAIGSNINNAVAALQSKFLDNMKVRLPIADGVGIDYSFLEIPYNPYVRLYAGLSEHQGAFYLTKGQLTCEEKGYYMLPDISSLMDIQLMLHQYMGNSLGCALYSAGLLDFMLNSKTAPKDFPIQFNTTVFQYVLPQLYQQYPNDAFEVHIKAIERPVVAVIEKVGVNVNVTGNISVIVMPKGSAPVSVLTIEATLYTLATAGFHKGNLTGHVHNATIQLEVKETKVGPISPQVLQFVSQVAIAAGVPYINQITAVGFPIPYLSSENIRLDEVHFLYSFEYIIINAAYTLVE